MIENLKTTLAQSFNEDAISKHSKQSNTLKSIPKVLNENLSLGIMSTLEDRLIKKINYNSYKECKNSTQQIINLYLNLNKNIGNESKLQLELLVDELQVNSLYEIRSKYQALLSQMPIDKIDHFLITILKKIFNEKMEDLIDQENNHMKQDITTNQFNWAPIYRDEMLRLLINAKKKEYNLKKIDFKCYILDYRELPFFLKMMNQRVIELQDSHNRFFLIVRNQVHYTALEFYYQGVSKSCTIMDASEDPKHLLIEKQLQNEGFDVIAVGEIDENKMNESDEDKIQWDTKSCSIFSFDQLSKAAKGPPSYQEMVQHPLFNSTTHRIPWAAVNANLIQNCQNLNFFDNYLKTYQKFNNPTDKEYYKLTQFLNKNIDPNRIDPFERNLQIENKLIKHRETVQGALNNLVIDKVVKIARTHPFQAILNQTL